MKNNAFLINTVILTATSFFLRIIGITLISFMSQKIGAEGIGLYQLIFSVYTLASAFAISGISTAVTRLVAEEAGLGARPTSTVLRKCICFACAVSISVALALFNLAGFIGTNVLNDARTINAIKILAPSLPFMAVTACFRGYFIGRGKILKSASSQIFEEMIRMSIIMGTIGYFLPRGLETACYSIVIGSTGAEMIGCGYAWALYFWDKRKDRIEYSPERGVLKKILAISLPIAASFYLRTGLRTAEGILIPSSLERYGLSNQKALAQYGIIMGMAMPILLFPTVLLFSLSTLLVPEIAKANAAGNQRRVSNTVTRVIQMTALLAILCSGIFIFFSGRLGMALYQNKESGEIMAILAPLLPLMYLDIVVDSMLNGLNQQMHTLKYNIADSMVRISMIFLLIPLWGLPGFLIAFFSSSILNSLLSTRRLVKVAKIKVSPADWIIKPVLSAGAAGSVVLLLFRILAPGLAGNGFVLVAEICFMVLLYIGFLFWTGCVTKSDILWFKKRFQNTASSPKLKMGKAKQSLYGRQTSGLGRGPE